MTLTGYAAIEYAEANDLPLNKYNDPIEEAREGLTPDEARAVAREDSRLIWISIISVGDAVEAGTPDTEDHDTGIVHAIDGDMAEVGWKSGQRTKIPIADLRHAS